MHNKITELKLHVFKDKCDNAATAEIWQKQETEWEFGTPELMDYDSYTPNNAGREGSIKEAEGVHLQEEKKGYRHFTWFGKMRRSFSGTG